MSKSMTTDSVRSDFTAAANSRDTDLGASGKVVSKFKPVTSHQQQANELQQHRNGVKRQFDAPEDRGPSISAAAGMTPTKC